VALLITRSGSPERRREGMLADLANPGHLDE
jgi:hypothetical protein